MEHLPRDWPFVRGIHRSPVNSPHKGQWRGASIFSLFDLHLNGWVKNRDSGDLRRHCAHYDVTVMHWSDSFVSDRCLIHVVPMVLSEASRSAVINVTKGCAPDTGASIAHVSMPRSVTVKIYLNVFVFILYCVYERHCSYSFLLWTLSLSVCFRYIYLVIVYVAYLFI